MRPSSSWPSLHRAQQPDTTVDAAQTLDHGAVRRIAVFRALMLGDLLCATPALRALRHSFPRAEITLIGLPWASSLAERLSCVDRFENFPGHPGLPEATPDLAAWPGFLERMQSRDFDLLIQMHGSGDVVNTLLSLLGARRMAGFVEPDRHGGEPSLSCAWPERGTEVERLLTLTDRLGAARRGDELEFPVSPQDRERLHAAVPELERCDKVAVVHAGAQLSSRRWPVERFAEVADALARRGLGIVLTGSESEQLVVRELQLAMRETAINLCGRTGLFELGALIERARLVVCNDTGLSHIAAALRVPSLVISSGADVERWAPRDAQRHRVLWHDVACRPCAFRTCPYDHACARGVQVVDVVAQATALLAAFDEGCVYAMAAPPDRQPSVRRSSGP